MIQSRVDIEPDSPSTRHFHPGEEKEGTMTDSAVRPFEVHVPDDDLADLRRRIAATRWPDKETIADESPGAQLAQVQELVRYWVTAMTGGSSRRG